MAVCKHVNTRRDPGAVDKAVAQRTVVAGTLHKRDWCAFLTSTITRADLQIQIVGSIETSAGSRRCSYISTGIAALHSSCAVFHGHGAAVQKHFPGERVGG